MILNNARLKMGWEVLKLSTNFQPVKTFKNFHTIRSQIIMNKMFDISRINSMFDHFRRISHKTEEIERIKAKSDIRQNK